MQEPDRWTLEHSTVDAELQEGTPLFTRNRSSRRSSDNMTNTKFVVKVNRGGTRAPEYVQRVDRTPVQMALNRKLALVMGKLTAEDAVKSLQNSRRISELVSVQVAA